MYTSVNPGLFTAPGEHPLIVFVLLAIALAFVGLGILFIRLASSRDKPSAALEQLAVWPFVIGFALLLSAIIAPTIVASAERSDALAEYGQDVRAWLNSDYGIDVTEAEALQLVGDEQIAVGIDGALTAIHLIDGPAETVQVQIVGGSVLTPAE